MIILFVLVIFWLVYKWSVETFDYYDKIGIPYEKPMPLVGNMWKLVTQKESFVDITRESYRKFKKSR
jgi:hypothetical protein